MDSGFLLFGNPFGSSFRLRELLDRYGVKSFDLRRDGGGWVLDLKDGRRLRLSPHRDGSYRMVLESSGGSHDVGVARLINGHFVLGQQAADSLGRVLGGGVGDANSSAVGGGSAGGAARPVAGGGSAYPEYSGPFPGVDDVLRRLGIGVSPSGGTAQAAGGGQSEGRSDSQQSQQSSGSRSWLGELTDLLKTVGPWLVLAMMMRGGQRSQNPPIIWG